MRGDRTMLAAPTWAKVLAWAGALMLIVSSLAAQGAWTGSVSPGLATLSVPGEPAALAISDDARILVATLQRESGIAIVDPLAGTLLRTVKLPAFPRAVAATPRGDRAFVLDDAATITVIDTASGALLARYAPGGQPVALAMRPDGSELAVADASSRRVLMLDPASGKLLRSVTLTTPPTRVAFGRSGTRLLAGAGGTLWSFDVRSLAAVGSVPLGDEILSLGYVERGVVALALGRKPDALAFLDIEASASEASLAIDGGPSALSIDPTFERAWIATREDGALNLAGTALRALQGRYRLPGRPGGIAVMAPSGHVLVSLPDSDELLRLDPGTAPLLAALALSRQPRDVAVNDTTHEAISVEDKLGEVARLRLADGSRQVIRLAGQPRRVVVDEGRNIAVVAVAGKQHQIVRIDLAQSPPMVLPGSFVTASEVTGLAVDSVRGLTVALASGGAGYVIDNATLALRSTFRPARPHRDVAISAKRGIAYVVSDDQRLLLIDLTRYRTVGAIALGFRGDHIAIWDRENRAVVTERRSSKARVIDLATGKVLHEITLPKHPGTLAIQQGSGATLISSGESDRLSHLVLTPDGRATGAYSINRPGRVAISARYNRALVASAELSELVVLALPNPAPELTSITPTDVLAGSTDTVLTLTGKRFVDASRVKADKTALVTTWVSPETLTATLPAALLQDGKTLKISVETPEPGGGVTGPLPLEVRGSKPTLASVQPDRLEADGENKTLLLYGTGFVAGSVAEVGGLPIATTYTNNTQLSATIPGALAQAIGTQSVLVKNPGDFRSNALPVSFVAPAPRIASFTPASGPTGTVVTIAGSFFADSVAGNVVKFNGRDAIVTAASAVQIKALVPDLATSGPLGVTAVNGTGTSASPFTVTSDEDFALVVNPATLSVYQDGSTTATVQLSSTGRVPLTSTAALSAEGLPPGVTVRFVPASASATQTGSMQLVATGAATTGTATFTLRAQATVGGRLLSRTSSVTVTVNRSEGVTGIAGRFVNPQGGGIPGVIIEGYLGTTKKGDTFSDAAGNFLLTGLPAGEVTLQLDARPANPLYPKWPYKVTLKSGEIQRLGDWRIDPPPPEEKFVAIDNASRDQKITDPEYPGLEFTLPAGVTITGWDGVRKTRIAVVKRDVENLPVPPPPTNTRTAYQLNFGSAMGGIPSGKIPVTLPNDLALDPGEKADLWYFEGVPGGNSGEWKVAGKGTVSPDGSRIVSDPGVGLEKFCGVCGLACFGTPNPPDGKAASGEGTGTSCNVAGNPVNLSSGQELPSATDFECGGRVTVQWGRTYNPVDAFNRVGNVTGSFGFGWVSTYDAVLLDQADLKTLILPGNDRVFFSSIGGSLRNTTDRRFDGAAMVQLDANTWRIDFKGGGSWTFKPFSVGATRGIPFFLVEMADASGNVLRIGRDTSSKITNVVGGERSLSVRYGSNGFVSDVTDQLGRVVRYTYTSSSNPRLATITNAEGGVTRYGYVRDEDLPVVAACQNEVKGERIRTIHYPGNPDPTENFYGPGRRVLKQKLSDGSEMKFSYRLAGACVAHVSNPSQVCVGSACPNVDSWENYQAGWRIVGGTILSTTVTDAGGRAYTRASDARGYATGFTDSSGGRSSIALDASGRRSRVVDPLGRSARYRYDDAGNVTEFIDAIGRLTMAAYDSKWGKPTIVTSYLDDGSAISSNFTYHPDTGRLLTSRDPLGNVTRYEYDAVGQLLKVTSPLGRTVRLEYNSAGDVIAAFDPAGNRLTTGYDAVGRPVETTNPLGFTTTSQFNRIDQPVKAVDAMGGETKLQYDARHQLTGVVNPLGVTIESYERDPLGRVTHRTDATGKSTKYVYDAVGNLISVTDRKGAVTTITYDAASRIAGIAYPDGRTQSRTYDAVGRLREIREPGSVVTYAYDVADRVIREVQETGAGRAELGFEYDALDRLVRRTVAFNGSAVDVTQYAYDKASRLVQVSYTNPGFGITTPQAVTNTWNADGQLLLQVLPNGVRRAHTFDVAGRLLRIAYTRPDGSAVETIDYTYDVGGQRRSKSLSGESVQETPVKATYDTANRLNTLTLHPGTDKEATYSLSYDRNGNLARKDGPEGATTYSWDSRDRLTAIAGPGLSATFAYDVLGRRVSRTVNGTSTAFIYDGLQHVGEVVGSKVNASLMTGLALDEVFARAALTGNVALLADALGSVTREDAADGASSANARYSPYGESASTQQQLGYTGRESDGTGLLFYRARYYDPLQKRFVSEDPLGVAGGLNLYGYVGGDPVSFVDPTGLYLETGWDVFNFSLGLASLGHNVYCGNWGSAALDGLGLVYDGIATVTPILPGGASAALKAGRAAKYEKTFYRNMSKAEAAAIEKEKMLRGGLPGDTFFTDSRFRSADRAKDRLSLSTRPEVQMEFRITNQPELIRNGTRVNPKYGGRGGGREFMTQDQVQVEIINVQPY